jgi:hypothetical protein
MRDGVEAFHSADYDKAARSFLQAAMAEKSNVDGWLAYAVSRFASGDYEMAAMGVRRGVRQLPEVVNAPFDIRERYGNAEDFPRQLKALEDYVLENTTQADGWLVLGFIRHYSQQVDLGKRAFEVVQKRFPKDADLAGMFLDAKPMPMPPPDHQQQPGGEPEALPESAPHNSSQSPVDRALNEEEALRDSKATDDSTPVQAIE